MRLFDNLRLSVKLPILLGTLMLLALTAVSYSSYHAAKDALVKAGIDRMNTAMNAKMIELEIWFDGIARDLKEGAASPLTQRALQDFASVHRRFKAQASSSASPPTAAAAVATPNAAFGHSRNGEVTDFSLAANRYEQGFQATLREKSYHDVMLVDVAGNVVYSVMKEADLGQNVLVGQLRRTILAKVIRKVLQSPGTTVFFSEFAPYEPSGNQPTAFAAAPIQSKSGKIEGALVYQLSTQQLDALLSRHHGEELTLTTYVVGRNGRLISGASLEGNVHQEVLFGRLKVLDKAFSIEHSQTFERGIGGTPSVLFSGHLSLPGLEAAVVMEQSEKVLLQPVNVLISAMVLEVVMLAGVMAMLVFILARNLSRPLMRTVDTMQALASRRYDIPIPDIDRRDEIGAIARALQTFRDALAVAETVAHDEALKGVAFTSSSAAIMILDADLRITYGNQSVVAMFTACAVDVGVVLSGGRADAFVGKTLDMFLVDPPATRRLLADSANLPYQTEVRIGEARFALDINEVLVEGQGRIGYVAEWRDVTVERMNRAVLGAIDQSLVAADFDGEGMLLRTNGRLQKLLGVTSEALAGFGHKDVIRFEEAGALSEPNVTAQLLAGESVAGRFRIGVPGGREGVIDGSFSPVVDREGKLLKVLLLGSDVTEAEASLAIAEERRKALESAQSDVVEALRIGLSALSEGDLAIRVNGEFSHNYKTLQSDFNVALERLAAAVGIVVRSAEAIESEVRDIAEASGDMSRRTEMQAATLEQTAVALDQLTRSVGAAAKGAIEANSVARAAHAAAEDSGPVVREAVAAMSEIERSSEKIARIIGVIEDIAFQTNLLALNAGVEAARAGEAGRGFAVVAMEVRALAQRSSDAAREVDQLISGASAEIKRGVVLVDQTGKALDEVVISVSQITQRMGDIASSAQEQALALGEINSAVTSIDQVTQQNAAMFAQTAVAGQRLNDRARVLSGAVAHFRLGNTQDEKADFADLEGSLDQAFASFPDEQARAQRIDFRVNGTTGIAEEWGEF